MLGKFWTRVCVTFLVLVTLLVGCGANKEASKQSKEDEELGPELEPREPNLKIVSLAYLQAWTHRGKKPLTGLADLTPHYEADREQALTKALKEGAIVVLWNVDLSKPGARDKVIAYERDPDSEGKRFVATANGKLKSVSEEEFKTIPKASEP